MKRKRIMALVAAAALSITALAGCGASGGTETAGGTAATPETEAESAAETEEAAKPVEETKASEESEDAAQGEKAELTLMVTNQWTDVENNAYAAEFANKIAEFEAANNCTVKVEGVSQQDIKENFQTAALAGGGADMVIMDSSGHAIDLAAMGLLLPLSTFTTPEELEGTYQQGPLNSGKFEGEYYSMPWYMDCCGLYYNKDVLDECGLAVPTTWEELDNAISVVTEAGHGGISTYLSAYAFYSFFYQNECPVIDTTGEKPEVVIDNEAGKEAWDYICGLVEKGGLVESFSEATSWDKVYESFASGESTFVLGGDWIAEGVDKITSDLNYGMTTMVKGKTNATILGGWTWNINANTKNQDLCYAFAKFIASEDCDSVLQARGKISCRLDANYDKFLEGKERLKVFTEQYPYTMSRPAIINEKGIDQLIVDEILKVKFGEISTEDGLAELAQNIRDNISENYD